MSATDETQEHIRLLKSQGRITHIVSSTGDVPTSRTALVQRCLSAGLDDPVPLPDGTVAIYAPDGLPPTLEALQMTVMAIAPASTNGSGNKASDADRLVAIDSALRELEGRINGDLRFVRAGPAPDAEAEEGSTEAGGRMTEAAEIAVADEDAGDATSEELSEATASLEAAGDPLMLHPSGDLLAEDADVSAPSEAVVLKDEEDLGEQPGSIEPPSIEEPAASSEWRQDDPVDPSVPVSAEEVKTETVSYEEAAAALPFIPSAQAVEPLDEAPTPSVDFAAEEVAEPLIAPGVDKAFNAMAAQIGELTEAIEGQEREITALGAQLAALAERPVPRPDMSEANGHMARFATAFARALERLEAASARLETLPDPQQDTAIVEALEAIGARVSDVAEQVARGSGQVISPDLERMIALQEVLVRQTATILDARPVGHDFAMSEFLTDLRHTIAELIAEQKRTALAS